MGFDIFSYSDNGNVELLHAGLTPMETITAIRCNVNSDKEMQRDTVYHVRSANGVRNAYVSAVSPDGDKARKVNNHVVIGIEHFLFWLYLSIDISELVEDMCNDIEYFKYHNANLTSMQAQTIECIRDNLKFALNKLDNRQLDDLLED